MKPSRLISLLLAAILFYLVHIDVQKEKKERQKHLESLIWSPPPDDGKVYRGWDYNKEEWIEDKGYNYRFNPHLYSDEELQKLREELEYDTEGRYFHIPGKRILTREQEIHEEVERYIEDNIEDILDEYAN